MVKDDPTNGDITLRDILDHIQGVQKSMRGMEKRLTERIDRNAKGIEGNTLAIQRLEAHMLRRFSSIDEDIIALGMDIVTIKNHVGIPVTLE